MSYVAIIGTVVSVGVGAYQASQTEDAAASVGKKPKAAEYAPVNYGKMQLKTLADDYNAMPWISGVNDKANTSIGTQDMKRIMRFVPNFKSLMRQEALNSTSLLNGQLPYEDVLDIASNRGGLANSLGTPGGAGPATLKDLGISRLSAMQSGDNLFRNMVGIAEQVSPVSRYSRPQDFLLTPGQTIPWEIEQRQLEQQSLQNKNNLAAGVSPSALAGAAAQASGATNPYSSIGPALGAIGGMMGGGGGAGTNAAGEAQYAAGAVPRAQPVYSIPAT